MCDGKEEEDGRGTKAKARRQPHLLPRVVLAAAALDNVESMEKIRRKTQQQTRFLLRFILSSWVCVLVLKGMIEGQNHRASGGQRLDGSRGKGKE